MKKILAMSAALTIAATALAGEACDPSSHATAAPPVCTRNAEPVTRLVQANTDAPPATKLEKNRGLSKEELKREIKEEKKRKEMDRRAIIKQKRCAYLEQRMNAASDVAKSATGKNLTDAERNARRATERYVTECPK